MRFGKQNRLRLAKDFNAVRANSTKVDCSAFVFYLSESNTDAKCSRLAVVTSKKVGCAVERNKARRIIRAIFRNCAPAFSRPCDIIVYVRSGWAKFDFAVMQKKFERAASAILDGKISTPNKRAKKI